MLDVALNKANDPIMEGVAIPVFRVATIVGPRWGSDGKKKDTSQASLKAKPEKLSVGKDTCWFVIGGRTGSF